VDLARKQCELLLWLAALSAVTRLKPDHLNEIRVQRRCVAGGYLRVENPSERNVYLWIH
jgi:hypothetical protein